MSDVTTPADQGIPKQGVDAAASDIEGLLSDEFLTSDEPKPEAKKKQPEKKEPETEDESDPDEGEEDPGAETDEEEEPEGDEEEEAEGEEEEPEGEDEPTLYTVKVNGEESKVTVEELTKGYQREKDYTQKTQTLSAEKKEFETEQQAVRNERQRYAQTLQQMDTNADADLKRFQDTDWDRLKEEDPEEYRDKREDFRELRDAKSEIEAERKKTHDAEMQDRQAHRAKFGKEQAQKLLEKMPEWKDIEKRKVGLTRLRAYGVTQGYEEKEMNSILDHRFLVMAEKARKYDAFKKADPSKKKVHGKPKMTRPGASPGKKSSSKGASQKQWGNLKKTGKVGDAARVIESLME